MIQLTPREIVRELDRYIIGQDEAKRAVAVALRNRYRRAQLPPEIREEVTPKNILMVGPTGVGKTEIARRLAKLVDAPFVKVEATKFTEVGYVGRDVESIVRDLLEASIRLVKEQHTARVHQRAEKNAEERLADLIIKPIKKKTNPPGHPPGQQAQGTGTSSRGEGKAYHPPLGRTEKLRSGEMEHVMVEVEVEETAPRGEIPGTDMNMNDMLGSILPKRTKIRKVEVHEARRILVAEEEQNLIDMDSVYSEAIERAEQHGIVFLDEIDKVAGRGAGNGGPDVSREGVQRDILPIVEGSTVNTKYGPVRTDHMLFIAAGAFHVSKVTDLIPELQGRFPVACGPKAADARGLQAHTHPAGERPHPPVSDAFEGGTTYRSPLMTAPWTPSPTTPGRPTRPPKISARGGCTRCWKRYSTTSPSMPAAETPRKWRSR